MSSQGESVPPKKPKILACRRCRHRKQKCTEIRPCENCIQSGSGMKKRKAFSVINQLTSADCIPSDSAASKLPVEIDPRQSSYVQRLEERVAQLEMLIPQESLDHMNGVESQEEQPTVAQNIDNQACSTSSVDSQPAFMSVDAPIEHDRPTHKMPLAYQNPLVQNLDLFSSLSNIYGQQHQAIRDDLSPEAPDLGLQLEQYLIQKYFDMAHSQYPFLLKHDFLLWAESWRTHRENPSATLRWQGFFVNMVFAIAFLMTKDRVNGSERCQVYYAIATSKYLPSLLALHDPVLRVQGYLLLALYALHMPSTVNIITLSSSIIRYCVMAQLHISDTEPQTQSRDAYIQTQIRRRVFWCAYALDRAVCSSYNFPCCVADCHITVSDFDNIDDDYLLAAASSVSPGSPLVGSTSPTNVSSALHIFAGRKIESEIQEMTLRKDFVEHSKQSFEWRASVMNKLQEWNLQSKTLSDPSQKGYVSRRWLSMIYYYNLITLYRPTRTIVIGMAGDWSVQACSQALLLFRKFQIAREIAQPWLGLLTQFQIGVTLLYCFWATPPELWQESYRSADVPDAVRACSSTLAILAERWNEAECLRDVFEVLAREIPLGSSWTRPKRMSPAGVATIESNILHINTIVVHRPTLRMINEMATEAFPHNIQMDLDTSTNAEGMDLQWTTHHFLGQNYDSTDIPVYPDDSFYPV